MSLSPLPNIDILKETKSFLNARNFSLKEISQEFESSIEALISKTGLFSLIETQKEYFDENFWFFNKKVPLNQAHQHYSSDLIQHWLQSGLIQQDQDYIQSYFSWIPYDHNCFLGDRILNNSFSDHEQVMSASYSTMSLLKHLDFDKGPILELGCGSGFLGIQMALKTKSTLSLTDLNDRAVQLALLNSEINGLKVNCYKADWKEAFMNSKEAQLIIFNTPSMPVYKNNSLLVNFYGSDINQISIEIFQHIHKTKNKNIFLWVILCLTDSHASPQDFLANQLTLNKECYSFSQDKLSPFALGHKHILKRKIPIGNWLLQEKEDKDLFFDYLEQHQVREIVSGVIQIQT